MNPAPPVTKILILDWHQESVIIEEHIDQRIIEYRRNIITQQSKLTVLPRDSKCKNAIGDR